MKSERSLIQKKLYLSLLIIISLTIITSTSFYIYSTKSYKDKIISEYLDKKSSNAISSFIEKTTLIESNIQLFTKWGKNGLINLSDTSDIDIIFIPIIEDEKDIFAVTIFEESGKEYEIKKNGNEYVSQYYNVDKKNNSNALKWKKFDNSGNNIGQGFGAINKTRTKSEWHKYLNKTNTESNWVGPYYSEDFNQNVVSIISSWKNNNKTHYIIIHVLLKNIFGFLDKIELNENEYSFLLSGEGDVYDLRNNNDTQTSTSSKKRVVTNAYYKNKIPEISGAVKNWLIFNKDTENTHNFKVNNKSYCSKFTYLIEGRKKYVLAIVISQNSFALKIGEGKFLTFLLSLLFVFTGVIFSLFVILRYNKKLRKIPKPDITQNHFERDILRYSKSPESKTLEFKSTIRFNLHSEKNDKAIEQAWLKSVAAFLNTEGGVLIMGIDDAGNIQGIEKDNFENIDKASLHVKNLISKFLGIEFMKFVNIHSGIINKKPIIAMVCKQSTKPAYINISNEELFYIRIGPSSTKLTISQAIEHISNHGYKQLS